MADFYSPTLTERSDGLYTDWHSLGSGNFNGYSEHQHNIHLNIPIATSFDATDKVVLASVPSNLNLLAIVLIHSAWSAGSTMKLGIYNVNGDGTIGTKASAGSDVAFGPASTDMAAGPNTFVALFPTEIHNAAFDFYDVGKQMWELVNLLNPGTYPSDPGGQFALAMEFIGDPATTTVVQESIVAIRYAVIG